MMDNDVERDPSEGKLLEDGSIEFRMDCHFNLSSAGDYERASTYWSGTTEMVGPDHGIYSIPDHPTGFEGDDIIKGFIIDADSFGMFDEGQTYVIIADVRLDTLEKPLTRWRRFTYQPGMFDHY